MRPCWSRITGPRPTSAEVIAFGNHVSGLTDRTATLTLTDGPTVDAAPSFSRRYRRRSGLDCRRHCHARHCPDCRRVADADLFSVVGSTPCRHLVQPFGAGYQRGAHGDRLRDDPHQGHQLRGLG